jgi:glycosyltransferase involved in cell wall biosynthesis
MRVAVVTETFPPEVNGVAATAGLMVSRLRQRGHDIQVIRPRQALEPEAKGSDPHTVVMRGMPIPGYSSLRLGLPATGRLQSLWRERRPDIVWIVTEGPLGWSGVRAAQRLRLPIASDFRTNFHFYSRHYGAGWLMQPIAAYLRHLHNRTDLTMVPTEELRERLHALAFRELAVVSRGVDTALFNPTRRRAELRRSWGASPETPVVVHVGRLAAEKNLALLFRAFEAMRNRVPGARLVVVGDGPERARLERQYPGHHFAGVQRGERLAEHFASGDIFLYPSLSETFGNVTVEAMASGLAVVAYDYAAAREHLRHDVNGMAAAFDDDGAFVAHARTLIGDPHRVRRLRAAARVTALTIDWERVIDTLERELAQVVRRACGSRPDTTGNFEAPHGLRTR